MKCIHCGGMWNTAPIISVTRCPFCGKLLEQEKINFETIEDVLTEINRCYGRV